MVVPFQFYFFKKVLLSKKEDDQNFENLKTAPNNASTAMCAMRAHVVDAGTLYASKKKENHPFKKAQGKKGGKIIRLIKSNYNFESTDKKVILSFSQKKCNQ